MIKQKKTLFDIFLTISFIFLFIIGFWNLSVIFIPLSGLLALALIKIRELKKQVFNIKMSDIALILIVVAEFAVFISSSYQSNTFPFLLRIFVILLLYLSYQILSVNPNFNTIINASISLYGVMLGIGTLFFFLVFHFNITYEGFEDITNFRSLYHPFGSLSNDWTAILLAFLPFVLISVFKYLKHEYLRFVFIPGFFIICFGIILSFSRGAYLALATFLTSAFFLLFCFRIFSNKNLLIYLFSTLIIFLALTLSVSHPVKTTLQGTKTTSQVRSIEGRLSTWKTSLTMSSESPLLGIGSGNFALKYVKAKSNSEDVYFTGRVSNTMLQLFIEKGVIGLLAYALLILVVCCVFAKVMLDKQANTNDKLTAAAVVSCVLAMIVKESTFSSLLEKDGVLVLMGMIMAMSRKQSKSIFSLNFRQKGMTITVTLLLIVALALLGRRNYQTKKSADHITIALDSIQNKNYHEAIFHIEKSLNYVPNNAHYHNIKALALQRLSDKQLKISAGIVKADSYKADDIHNLERIKNEYLTSLKLNSEDDLAHHNLGWTYFELNSINKALFHLEQANKIDPTITIYHISMGLVLEYSGELDKAFMFYKTAIRTSPDLLDSEFYYNLCNQYPSKTKSILNHVEKEIRKALERTDSPIYKARLAKVLIYTKQLKEAKRMLLDVVSILPNLNRPWLNLAYIYGDENTEEKMLSALKRATLLDPNDYLPHIKLAEYYYEKEQMHDALIYYTKSLERYALIRSTNSVRSKSVYKATGILDNIVPAGLLRYTKPKIPLAEICQNLSKIYDSKGNEWLAKYFSNAKYQNKIELQNILKTIHSSQVN
ncbi:MAG: tetratricopeptide (TPR) repeat protein/O-antigen ligase [Bacteroidia bacterium]|jgi:tetratricopeptide (TPR) repeat protein/O-antigen ligase